MNLWFFTTDGYGFIRLIVGVWQIYGGVSMYLSYIMRTSLRHNFQNNSQSKGAQEEQGQEQEQQRQRSVMEKRIEKKDLYYAKYKMIHISLQKGCVVMKGDFRGHIFWQDYGV